MRARPMRAAILAGILVLLYGLGRTWRSSGVEGEGGESVVGAVFIPYDGPGEVAAEHAFFAALTDERILAAVREAVENGLGPAGLSARIRPGDRVVVKTNIVNAYQGEGVVADVRVCRAACALALEAAGAAGSVTVVDACLGNGYAAFADAGYDDDGDRRLDGLPAVELRDLDELTRDDCVLVTDLAPQLFWGEIWLPRILRDADVLISLAVFKNHYNAGMTGALKNRVGCAPIPIYGVRWDAGGSLHFTPAGEDSLNEAIVDLNRARPTDVAILDGLTGNLSGPCFLGEIPEERHDAIIHPFFILASADPVALDAVATNVAGYEVASIPYLALAEAHGLGASRAARIRVEGTSVQALREDLAARYGPRGQHPFPDAYGSVNAARVGADREPPSLAEVIEPADEAEARPGPIEIRFRAADQGPAGIARVEILIDDLRVAAVAFDGQPAVEGSWIWRPTESDRGAHRIRVAAIDEAFYERASPEVTVHVAGAAFIRGEVNGDGSLDIGDPIRLLGYIFLQEAPPSCIDAADGNDDGAIDLGDAIAILQFLFVPDAPPSPDPYPDCGPDPTSDALGCASFAGCE